MSKPQQKISDPFLQIRIDEAAAAAAALEEQERLKAKAAELPALLKEQERHEQVGQAHQALEEALDLLAARLENLSQAAAGFQARFVALRSEVEKLQAEYAGLSQAHSAIRGELRRAYDNFQQATSQQVWNGDRPEWTRQQNNEAEKLSARLKEITIFPGNTSPYPDSVSFDPTAGAVAGQTQRPLSLRRQIGIR